MDTTPQDWMCLASRTESTHTQKKVGFFFTYLQAGIISIIIVIIIIISVFGGIWVNSIQNRVCSRGGGGGGFHIHAVVLSALEGRD